MRWLYIGLAVLGGLAPTIYIYLNAYNNPDYQGGAFDLGLVFLGLGLGFVAVPLGVGAGLLVAASVHIVLYLLRGRPGRARGIPDWPGNSATGEASWLSQARQDAAKSRPEKSSSGRTQQ